MHTFPHISDAFPKLITLGDLRDADQNAGYKNYAEKAVPSSSGFMIGQQEAGLRNGSVPVGERGSRGKPGPGRDATIVIVERSVFVY